MRWRRPTFLALGGLAVCCSLLCSALFVRSAEVDLDALLVPPNEPTAVVPSREDALVEAPTLQPMGLGTPLPSSPTSPVVTMVPTDTVVLASTTSGDEEEDAKAPPLPDLSVFPNPARGVNVTFRFQSPEMFQYIVNIYDRFGESILLLNGEGKGMVDVFWPLEQVAEGIYYYRIMAVHPKSGTIQKFPVGQLVVEKDPEPSRPKKLRRSVVGR